MVLDFLKRKKRWEGVHSLTLPRLSSVTSLVVPPEVPGLYTSRGEWSEEQGGRGEGATTNHVSGAGAPLSPPDVTWDTLKRIRRASTAARRPRTFGSCQWEGSLGKGGERHQSSPNLSLAAKPLAPSFTNLSKQGPDLSPSSGFWPPPPQEFSSLPQAESVLRFTRWERHNSLITLDIAGSQSNDTPSVPAAQQWVGDGKRDGLRIEDQDEGETVEAREEGLTVCREVEGEGDGGEGDEENDDSGLFYDSDSGISSLYEAIGGGGGGGGVKGRQGGEESTGVARLKSLLSGWGIDRHLQHLFITSPSGETSLQPDSGESCEILPFANLVPSDVTDPHELVVVVGEILAQKQELLSLKLLEVQLQLTDGEEFVSYLESVLIAREEGELEQSGNNVRQIRPLLRRLDSAWSLVASIKRRISSLEERIMLQREEEEEEDFSLRHSLLLLREQLSEAETLCDACVAVRARCEASVEKIAPEQFSRLRDLFDSRLKVLQVQGDLKAELHRTRLQAKLLAYAK